MRCSKSSTLHVIQGRTTAVFGLAGSPSSLVHGGHRVMIVVRRMMLHMMLLLLMLLLLLLLLVLLLQHLLPMVIGCGIGRPLTGRTDRYAVTRRRPVQRRRADAVSRSGGRSVFAPLDGMRVIPGTPPSQREVPFAGHLVLFLPLHPAVPVNRVHRAPVPRRFDGAQEFLKKKKTFSTK